MMQSILFSVSMLAFEWAVLLKVVTTHTFHCRSGICVCVWGETLLNERTFMPEYFMHIYHGSLYALHQSLFDEDREVAQWQEHPLRLRKTQTFLSRVLYRLWICRCWWTLVPISPSQQG